MALTTREKVMLGVVVAVIIVAGVVVFVSQKRIRTAGKIKAIGVEVYSDSNCTSIVDFIDWGTMEPGSLKGVVVYIKNIKNTNFTMTTNTSDWAPAEAQTYLTYDWNYTGEVLEPNEVLAVQLTLYCSPEVMGFTDFSFDIWIFAIEKE